MAIFFLVQTSREIHEPVGRIDWAFTRHVYMFSDQLKVPGNPAFVQSGIRQAGSEVGNVAYRVK